MPELPEMDLQELKLLVGIPSDETKDDKLLALILRKARSDVLSYCRRKDVVDNMGDAILDLAVIHWNRRGTEGESSRSEGGVTQFFEIGIPSDIKSVLNEHRKGKARRFR